MSHLLTIAAAVWTILVFATPHLGPRQLSLNMLNIHELSDRRRTRGGWGSSSSNGSSGRSSSRSSSSSTTVDDVNPALLIARNILNIP